MLELKRAKKILYMDGIAVLVYWIWTSRNKCIWDQRSMTEEEVVECVKKGVRDRMLTLRYKNVDKEYIEKILAGV